MEARELDEWMVYYSHEPWGSPSNDAYFGTIAASVYNSQGGVKNKALKYTDFFAPYSRGDEANQNGEAWLQKFKAMAANSK